MDYRDKKSNLFFEFYSQQSGEFINYRDIDTVVIIGESAEYTSSFIYTIQKKKSSLLNHRSWAPFQALRQKEFHRVKIIRRQRK